MYTLLTLIILLWIGPVYAQQLGQVDVTMESDMFKATISEYGNAINLSAVSAGYDVDYEFLMLGQNAQIDSAFEPAMQCSGNFTNAEKSPLDKKNAEMLNIVLYGTAVVDVGFTCGDIYNCQGTSVVQYFPPPVLVSSETNNVGSSAFRWQGQESPILQTYSDHMMSQIMVHNLVLQMLQLKQITSIKPYLGFGRDVSSDIGKATAVSVVVPSEAYRDEVGYWDAFDVIVKHKPVSVGILGATVDMQKPAPNVIRGFEINVEKYRYRKRGLGASKAPLPNMVTDIHRDYETIDARDSGFAKALGETSLIITAELLK